MDLKLRSFQLSFLPAAAGCVGLLEEPEELIEGACKDEGVVRELEMCHALRVHVLQSQENLLHYNRYLNALRS